MNDAPKNGARFSGSVGILIRKYSPEIIEVNMHRILIIVGAMLCAQSVQAQNQIEESRKALSVISDFANTMCADPDYKGSTISVGAGIKANAEVTNLLKKLADLKVQVAADAKRDDFKGLLQKDLLEATKLASSCRLEIFKNLTDKLLPKESATIKKPEQLNKSVENTARGFKDLKKLFGLPPNSEVGWGSSYEEFEKLLPPNERVISRTDVIAVTGKASINSIPASTQYFFEARKLSSVRLVVETWYENYDVGNVREGKSTFARVDGDPVTGQKVCSAAFVNEVAQRADGIFSKIRNLEARRVPHPDFVAKSYECTRYGCESESKSVIWAAGYKNSEANDISLEHVVRENYYSYKGNDYKVGEKRKFICSTQLIFTNKTIGGI